MYQTRSLRPKRSPPSPPSSSRATRATSASFSMQTRGASAWRSGPSDSAQTKRSPDEARAQPDRSARRRREEDDPQGPASGMKPEHAAYEREHPTPITPGTLVGRVVLAGDTVVIEDAASDPAYTWREGQQIGGFRTMLGVPVRKEARLIGVINVARMEVRPFSADEIELARTFADQAAIVIDNVRLLGTIERQREELAP